MVDLMTRRKAAAVLAASSMPGILRGQSAQDKGKRVIDDALAALGGDRFLAMKDRVEAGRAYSFYREELRGLAKAKLYTRYLIRPEPPVS